MLSSENQERVRANAWDGALHTIVMALVATHPDKDSLRHELEGSAEAAFNVLLNTVPPTHDEVRDLMQNQFDSVLGDAFHALEGP